MIETVVLGGTFNPVHVGHIALAQHVLAQGLAEEVWLMVSPQNPLKRSKATNALDAETRFLLAQLACSNMDSIRASDFEFNLPRPSFTYYTLQKLAEAFPTRRFSLLIGADNFLQLHRWKHPERIVGHFPILVYPRNGYPIKADTISAGITLIDTPLYPISSTMIRQKLFNGEDVSQLLHPAVERFLKARNIFTNTEKL